MKCKIRPDFLILFMCLTLISTANSQSLFKARDEGKQVYERYKNRPQAALNKPLSKRDRGVGILDRGELTNVTGNFGVLSNFHLFSPAFHWPSWADDTHQYCFGMELLVGVKGDVITSIHDPNTVAENFDWEAQDGSLGNLFSGNLTASDGTPLLAGSDNMESWPQNSQGKPFWPGQFRQDPQTGRQVPGEFVSERDIYSEYTDQNNINGSYGLKVRQTAYSFSRSYARNFIIFDFQIINTSSKTLDSVWIGYMTDFKVDFDAHDHIRFKALEDKPGAKKDLVYLWDADPNEGIWDITGYIGLLSLFTPQNKGITDFHYFDNIYEPSTNEQIWEIMSSDTSGNHITRSNYFHGNNFRIDDDALADDMDPSGQKLGTDFVYILSSGPASLTPGDTVHSAFAVVMGATDQEMFANAQMVKNMSRNYYLGPNAPKPPALQAFSGDRRITLTWDGQTAENSRDLLTGKMDFEGYKIYRSEDFGQSWGKQITDEHGNIIGYVPVAQFDLDNTISGKDPNSNFYLGNNSGLKHTFIDSTVNNGVEYWYAITAYDRGDIATGVPALESSRGINPDEVNVVSAVPGAPASGIDRTNSANLDSLSPVSGICDSRLSVQILDPAQLTGHHYRVTFNDVGMVITADNQGVADTAITTTFNLIDLSTNDTLLFNHPLLNESGDNIPATRGFRILPEDIEPEVKFMGWTLVHGDTCTFDWHREVRGNETGKPWMNGWDDFRITFDQSGPGIPVKVSDEFGATWGPEMIPVSRVELITDPSHPVDVTENTWLIDYAFHGLSLPEPESWFQFFGPMGWDLVPGGKGYNPNVEKWPDALSFRNYFVDGSGDTVRVNGVDIRTQNRPGQLPPADGDQYTIISRKPFRSAVSYEFETAVPNYSAGEADLSRVSVVPNPYIVRAGWERSQFEGRVQFTHLPSPCDIQIYTTAGDHVITLKHEGPFDYEFWNLQNESGINVAYGLYVFIVKTPSGEKHTGKFVIIR
ncbi:MAG: hypothetical protein P8184_12225 [Calditrichia bacterium]